jgi:ketosteroid isomerase-like protein
MTDWLESFEEFYFEPEEFIDAGDDVVVPTAQKGRGKGSGAAVEMTATSVYTVRNGKIRSWREYSTKARALEAIGRSE